MKGKVRQMDTMSAGALRLRSKRIGGRLWSLLRFVIVFGLAFIILKPFISKLLMSAMSPDDLLDPQVLTIPKHVSGYYWKAAWNGLKVGSSILNSVCLTVVVAILQTLCSALVGYGLSRFQFRGHKLLLGMVIMLMIVPPQTYSVAQYIGFRYFGLGSMTVNLLNSYGPFILLSVGGLGMKQGLYIYLFYAFFGQLPRSLEDAAYIDGAGPLPCFFRIILPNARSIIITVLVFSVSWQWTDVGNTDLYLKSWRVMSTNIQEIYIRIGLSADTMGSAIAQNTACLILMVPILILFLICQRAITQSIVHAGLAN